MKERTIRLKWSYDCKYVEGNKGKIPESEGVYEVFVELKSGPLRRIYVGQGEDLRERLLRHLQESEPNECLKENLKKYVCWFRYARVSDERDRKDAEQALYDKRKYQCNETRPPGSGRGLKIILIEEGPE